MDLNRRFEILRAWIVNSDRNISEILLPKEKTIENFIFNGGFFSTLPKPSLTVNDEPTCLYFYANPLSQQIQITTFQKFLDLSANWNAFKKKIINFAEKEPEKVSEIIEKFDLETVEEAFTIIQQGFNELEQNILEIEKQINRPVQDFHVDNELVKLRLAPFRDKEGNEIIEGKEYFFTPNIGKHVAQNIWTEKFLSQRMSYTTSILLVIFAYILGVMSMYAISTFL